MKQFNINVHYDVCVATTVYAETEDDAREMAKRQAEQADLNGCDCDQTDVCVTSQYDYRVVNCKVKFKDDTDRIDDVKIIVGCDGEHYEELLDEQIFFYCCTEEVFNNLCKEDNREDFVVVEHD